jgi:hypothetical protein
VRGAVGEDLNLSLSVENVDLCADPSIAEKYREHSFGVGHS